MRDCVRVYACLNVCAEREREREETERDRERERKRKVFSLNPRRRLALLFKCTPVGRISDSMTVPT